MKNICKQCRHFDQSSIYDIPACAAFPSGIPTVILNGQDDHRKPVDGDGGVHFEKI